MLKNLLNPIKKLKETIDAKNALEGYAYNMRNTIDDKDKLGDKIEAEDKESISDAIKETLEWIEDNKEATKEDFEDKLKTLEGVCNPIITKLYQANGGAPGGAPGGSEDEPEPDFDSMHDDL